MIREDETHRIHEAAVTVVRVTPRDDTGMPLHAWAYAFHFDEPVFFATALHATADVFSTVTRRELVPTAASVMGAFLTSNEPADRDSVQALAYALWQRWRNGAAVEVWADIDTDSWLYTLIPAWYDQADTDRWTVEEPKHREVHAVGKIRAVDTYPWPDPSPLPNATPVDRHSSYLMGVTDVPPPAPGYTNLATA